MTTKEFQTIMTILDEWANKLPCMTLIFNTRAFFCRVADQDALVEEFQKATASVMKEKEYTDVRDMIKKWNAQVRRSTYRSSKKDETKVYRFTEAEDLQRLKDKLSEYFKNNWE